MKLTYLLTYLAGVIFVLAPVGIRVLTWRAEQGAVDQDTAKVGQSLFVHEWTPNDPLSPHGDGLGPVYNASSCVACHHQGGAGGSGGNQHNVTIFAVQPSQLGQKPREGVVHAQAVKFRETLGDVHPDLAKDEPSLQFVLSFSGKHKEGSLKNIQLSQRNTPALFGAKVIDDLPERAIVAMERRQQLRWGRAKDKDLPIGRAMRLPDGRIGKFGWKAQSASLADFVQAACANELGLGNPGSAQPRPLGKLDYQPPGLDLTLDQCNQLTSFVASLPAPREIMPGDIGHRYKIQEGKDLFTKIGCADCHQPSIGTLEGIYSDLLLHHMGEKLVSRTSSYNGPSTVIMDAGPSQDSPADEWRTPPLWGVADSAPYLHDGRAATLADAIKLHGGQALNSNQHFAKLSPVQQEQVLEFLKSLRAP